MIQPGTGSRASASAERVPRCRSTEGRGPSETAGVSERGTSFLGPGSPEDIEAPSPCSVPLSSQHSGKARPCISLHRKPSCREEGRATPLHGPHSFQLSPHPHPQKLLPSLLRHLREAHVQYHLDRKDEACCLFSCHFGESGPISRSLQSSLVLCPLRTV